ncbi:hypothetical protein [Bradyrhizobium brasilense]|uniref:hypothetical protein n=1 Tax=Bradyrhizobium brasilense TaxID=1419277 RepID=UPI001F1BA149|nr:hypothetical protein [Bradyrhizobium brasilense]
METTGFTHRQKGSTKSQRQVQATFASALDHKEVKQLRALARANTPTGVISLKMERPKGSITRKAQREGISLRPINRSPYNRRKEAVRR